MGLRSPQIWWDMGPAKVTGAVLGFPQLLCPQRAKPTGARYPRVNREASVLFPIIQEQGRAEG